MPEHCSIYQDVGAMGDDFEMGEVIHDNVDEAKVSRNKLTIVSNDTIPVCCGDGVAEIVLAEEHGKQKVNIIPMNVDAMMTCDGDALAEHDGGPGRQIAIGLASPVQPQEDRITNETEQSIPIIHILGEIPQGSPGDASAPHDIP